LPCPFTLIRLSRQQDEGEEVGYGSITELVWENKHKAMRMPGKKIDLEFAISFRYDFQL
jgi:hypothetical protein